MNKVLQFPKSRQGAPNATGARTVLYRRGAAVVREDGKGGYEISDQAEHDREAILCLLRLSQIRWGNRVAVRSGNERMLEAFARVAAEERLDIEFCDEALDNRRRQLLAEQDRRARGARPQLVAAGGQQVAVPQPVPAAPPSDQSAAPGDVRTGILAVLGVTGAVFGLLFLFFGLDVAVRTTLFIGGVIVLWGIGAAFGAQIALGILALLPLAYFLFFAGEGARALVLLLIFGMFLFLGGWVILLAAFLIMGVFALISSITGLPLTGPVFQWAAILLAVGGGIYGMFAADAEAKAARAARAERYARATPEERTLMDIQDELKENRKVLAQNQATLKSIRFWQRWG